MKTLKNKIIISLCVAALLVVTSVKVNAQVTDPDPQNTGPEKAGAPKIEVGARFMPVFSSFKMSTSEGTMIKGTAILGYGFGALLGLNFNDHVGIQAEVIYSSIGRKYTEVDVNRRINLRYLNIPVLLSINSGKFKPVNLNLVIGPQLGIMAGSAIYTSGTTTTDTPIALLSVRKSDLSLAYGAGLDFGCNHSGTFRIGVGFRGTYGMVDISHSGLDDATSYYLLHRTHIQTYSIYTGLSFLF
jgi:hypothetical protein